MGKKKRSRSERRDFAPLAKRLRFIHQLQNNQVKYKYNYYKRFWYLPFFFLVETKKVKTYEIYIYFIVAWKKNGTKGDFLAFVCIYGYVIPSIGTDAEPTRQNGKHQNHTVRRNRGQNRNLRDSGSVTEERECIVCTATSVPACI